jgi:hypothetical protein
MEFLSKAMKKKIMDAGKDWKVKEKAKAKEDAKAARVIKSLALKEKKQQTHKDNKEQIRETLKGLMNDINITTVNGLIIKAMKAEKEVKLGITREDVREFWRTQDEGQITDMKGYSSWVGSLPREQYHIDIAYISKANSGPKEKASMTSGTLPGEELRKDEIITEDGVVEVEPEDEEDEEEEPVPKAKAKAKAKPKQKGIKHIAYIWTSSARRCL